jgi:hypothetical protein
MRRCSSLAHSRGLVGRLGFDGQVVWLDGLFALGGSFGGSIGLFQEFTACSTMRFALCACEATATDGVCFVALGGTGTLVMLSGKSLVFFFGGVVAFVTWRQCRMAVSTLASVVGSASNAATASSTLGWGTFFFPGSCVVLAGGCAGAGWFFS